MIARYEAYYQEARMAYERAADGPNKDTAGLQLGIAESAAMIGHEVDFLLAIFRAIRALK